MTCIDVDTCVIQHLVEGIGTRMGASPWIPALRRQCIPTEIVLFGNGRLERVPSTVAMQFSAADPAATTWRSEFFSVLDGIPPAPGTSFVTTGSIPDTPTAIEVVDVGRLQFPLVAGSDVVEALKVVAQQKPGGLRGYGYSKGYDPFENRPVQNSWDIDANRDVKVKNGPLTESIRSNLIDQICRELGFPSDEKYKMHVEPYKLIVTEMSGSPNFDVPRFSDVYDVIATIIVPVPSQFTGGSLVVCGKDTVKALDLSLEYGGSMEQWKYIAYYSGSRFAFQPPTSGVRACLVYNLVATRYKYICDEEAFLADMMDKSSSFGTDRTVLESQLQAFVDEWDSKCDHMQLGYQLDHQYMKETFAAPFLKGRDRVLFQLLGNAKSSSTGKRLFDVYLALLERHDSNDSLRPVVVLDMMGASCMLLFNKAGGGSTFERTMRVDSTGWLVDADPSNKASSPFSNPLSISLPTGDCWYQYNDSGSKVPDPYYPAAIFISPARI